MKRLFLSAWLLAFAAWPLAHFGLVRSYDIDPWKFAGWATFATPLFPTNVFPFQIDYRSAATLDDIKAIKLAPAYWSNELRSEVKNYAALRTNFGRLMSPPERLGRKLLDEHGETGMVMVAVQTRWINRVTGQLETEIEKYPYSAEKMNPESEAPR